MTGEAEGVDQKHHVNNQSNPSGTPRIHKLQITAFWDVNGMQSYRNVPSIWRYVATIFKVRGFL